MRASLFSARRWVTQTRWVKYKNGHFTVLSDRVHDSRIIAFGSILFNQNFWSVKISFYLHWTDVIHIFIKLYHPCRIQIHSKNISNSFRLFVQSLMEIVDQCAMHMNMNTQHKYQLHIGQLFECIWNKVDVTNWEHHNDRRWKCTYIELDHSGKTWASNTHLGRATCSEKSSLLSKRIGWFVLSIINTN